MGEENGTLFASSASALPGVKKSTYLDHVYLCNMFTAMPTSAGFEDNLIESFLSDLEKGGGALIANIKNTDYTGMLSSAHALKGSAKQMGAKSLGDYCHDLRLIKRSELNQKRADELIAEFISIKDKTVASVQSYQGLKQPTVQATL